MRVRKCELINASYKKMRVTKMRVTKMRVTKMRVRKNVSLQSGIELTENMAADVLWNLLIVFVFMDCGIL